MGKKGKWKHSIKYSEMLAAKEWGLLPSEFYNASTTDQAKMMATEQANLLIQAFNVKLENDRIEKEKRKAG